MRCFISLLFFALSKTCCLQAKRKHVSSASVFASAKNEKLTKLFRFYLRFELIGYTWLFLFRLRKNIPLFLSG